MSEYEGNSYVKMIEESNYDKLEMLNKIKNFMSKPDYKQQKENYIAEKEINIKDIKINDLASLEYDQILKICK